MLDAEEAADLLADDFAAPTPKAPWRRLPPRVLTVEAFAQIKQKAEERKVCAAQIIFEQDLAQDLRDRQFFKVSMRSPVGRRQNVTADVDLSPLSTLRVSGRALQNISGPLKAEFHMPGAVVEGLSLVQAWDLADSGALGPL